MNLVASIPTIEMSPKLFIYLCVLEGSKGSNHDKKASKILNQVQ